VLLHLLVATRSRRYRRTDKKEERRPNGANGHVQAHGSQPAALAPLKSIYITCSSPFDAVEEFVSEAKGVYNLDLFRTSPGGIPMKEALSIYQRAEPGVKAILVGTRRDDPHGSACSIPNMTFLVASINCSFHIGKLDFKTPTDPDWPSFLRVHPIINWTYDQIWEYLQRFSVPYCSLYDQGHVEHPTSPILQLTLGAYRYTSLGSTHNTYRNPALRDQNGDYRAAYELHDGSKERCGRSAVDPALTNTPL